MCIRVSHLVCQIYMNARADRCKIACHVWQHNLRINIVVSTDYNSKDQANNQCISLVIPLHREKRIFKLNGGRTYTWNISSGRLHVVRAPQVLFSSPSANQPINALNQSILNQNRMPDMIPAICSYIGNVMHYQKHSGYRALSCDLFRAPRAPHPLLPSAAATVSPELDLQRDSGRTTWWRGACSRCLSIDNSLG